jgi:hypothetical protein
MEKWHIRLARRIHEKGWSKAEFARRAGLHKDRVYKYLAGKVERPPDIVIKAMADAVGWSPEKLMYDVDPHQQAGTADAMANDEPSSMRRILSWYDWEDVAMLIAGGANGARTARIKGKMPVPPEDGVSEAAFYFTAPDDANAPDISKGDLLICEPGRQREPTNYVLATIKGHNAPVLAQYIVEKYRKGVPAIIALVYCDEERYGRHAHLKASEVTIHGVITYRTSRLVPPSTTQVRSR